MRDALTSPFSRSGRIVHGGQQCEQVTRGYPGRSLSCHKSVNS